VRLVGTENFADLYGGSISAVSVPVFDPHNAMVLALTAIGHRDQLDTAKEGRLMTGLLRAAADIMRRLNSPGAAN
jgi:DNA-binding IclR family transcriptional regulator